ncbi:MAG TPA: hypothetical protein DF818_07980 [Bacteroidales bacterium]|nr:hypothetical protein [Bacteroidales bacterium]
MVPASVISVVIYRVSRVYRVSRGISESKSGSTSAVDTHTPCIWLVIVPVRFSKNRSIIVERSVRSVKSVYPG